MFEPMIVDAAIKNKPEELRHELEQIMQENFGASRRIVGLRRRHSNYSSSCAIENLEIQFKGGKSLKLIFKDLSPRALLSAASKVRPHFLYDPQREIEIYRRILRPQDFQTARYYGAVEDAAQQRYWLFLERVDGPLLWQVGRFERWEGAARWLGRFHHRFRVSPGLRTNGLPTVLLRYDAAHCLRWIERAEKFLAAHPGLANNPLKQQFRRLAKRYDQVVDQLLLMPSTLIHGEFYPSNIILRTEDKTKNVCPIDWELAAVGPAFIDLAALVSGDWNEEEKRRLVATYTESLNSASGGLASLKEILRSVDLCQLHLAVQWLGWAPDWAPPESHQQNWLGEVVRLGKRLELI